MVNRLHAIHIITNSNVLVWAVLVVVPVDRGHRNRRFAQFNDKGEIGVGFILRNIITNY